MPRRRELQDVEADVVDLYREGYSTVEIAGIYRTSLTPVRRILRDAGVTLRPRGPLHQPLRGREEAAATLYRVGFSLRDLARFYRCSTVAVKGALRKTGEPLRPRGSHATRGAIELRQQLLGLLEEAAALDSDEAGRRAVAEAMAIISKSPAPQIRPQLTAKPRGFAG